jgi:hypothetical protein
LGKALTGKALTDSGGDGTTPNSSDQLEIINVGVAIAPPVHGRPPVAFVSNPLTYFQNVLMPVFLTSCPVVPGELERQEPVTQKPVTRGCENSDLAGISTL